MKKILLVEDTSFIADIYARELRKAGYEVKMTNDGLKASQILEQETFDLLLLDILLPNIHGLELLRQWKSKHPNSPMVILLLTNLGQDAVIKEAFTLGAQGYLVKSAFTPAQIVEEVKSILEKK
ncbi:MAG: response regulator [Candidatus Daviesbacteria bacterium]